MSDARHDDPARTSRRRRQAVVGAVGLAAVLSGAAVLVTGPLTGDDTTTTRTTGADAPSAAGGPESPPRSAAPSAGPATPAGSASAAVRGTSPGSTGNTTAPPLSKATEERIKAAREAARKDGHPVRRPVPQATLAAVPEVTVTNSGSLRQDRGTMRVVSGRGDLTGYRELGWVSGDGEAVGNARCSQTFRFAQEEKPSRKANLLVCWRTSAAKSVYTVTVNIDGKPSKQKSVAAIETEWARLG
ncbi:MAG TPA: hypothetical protein VFH03_12890 [Actinoplanes sp.]|nr:hypothetical protein [Actinoplanes sp.]